MTDETATDLPETDTEPEWHRQQREAGTLTPAPSLWSECSWCISAWLAEQL